MKQESRMAVYDAQLSIEAYLFSGIVQPFPAHFHDYYVMGLIEQGERVLFCQGEEYRVKPGDMLLFNPGDIHACTQHGVQKLTYRSCNIAPEIMNRWAESITDARQQLRFSVPVIEKKEAAEWFRLLHKSIMQGAVKREKEEIVWFLISLLFRQGQFESCSFGGGQKVAAACAFLEQHSGEPICLDMLCRQVGLSKSTLLRVFIREKGITPHRYLENIRIHKSQDLLQKGISPAESALQAGFSDQSHLTNRFKRLIGLTPGAYQKVFQKRR